MAEYRLTPRAHKDLRAIAAYTLKIWGRNQVQTYLQRIADRMQWLADNPRRARSREDVGDGYRCFREGQHLIFFIVKDDHIAIIGVPHSSMDIQANLGRKTP
ncbi:MAG: type II toxin-antitoxin system RelE/ParE family toxin [Sphingomonadales bacterium]